MKSPNYSTCGHEFPLVVEVLVQKRLLTEEVRQAQLKQLATDYSQQKHTMWAGRGRIIIAQSKANCLSCTAPVGPPLGYSGIKSQCRIWNPTWKTELTFLCGGHNTSTFYCHYIYSTCKLFSWLFNTVKCITKFAIDLHTPWVAGSAKFHIYTISLPLCNSVSKLLSFFLQGVMLHICYLSGVRIEHVIGNWYFCLRCVKYLYSLIE